MLLQTLRVPSRPGAPGTQDDFERLARTIWRLRQQDGCPWDREQTHESIRKNMIEEAYETAEAIDEGNSAHLCEELGDVLMQVLLHAQIADDAGEFTLADVCRGLNEKLVRRHPHVFNDKTQADSADEVLDIWENVKSDEREKAFRTRRQTRRSARQCSSCVAGVNAMPEDL